MRLILRIVKQSIMSNFFRETGDTLTILSKEKEMMHLLQILFTLAFRTHK